MTEKQKKTIDNLIITLSKNDREIFREIAEYAVELGYIPSQVKNVHGWTDAVVFTKTKTGKSRRLCKINPLSAGKNKELYNTGKPLLSLQFSATKKYSNIFHEAVKQEHETLKIGFKSCKGCNSCASPYVYKYPDGKTVLCCGGDNNDGTPANRCGKSERNQNYDESTKRLLDGNRFHYIV